MHVRWNLVLREVRRHPGRALLTMLSVVIGVAAVVSVGLSTGSARRAYQQMSQAVTGKAALEVSLPGEAGVPDEWVGLVEQVPGVAAAVPNIKRPAIMYMDDDRRVKLIAMGIEPEFEAKVRDYELADGELFHEGQGVVLDLEFARGLRLGVGDRIKLGIKGRRITTSITGLLAPQTGSAATHGSMLFMPLQAAQKRFDFDGFVDQIQVVLADGAELASVERELESRLPPGALLRKPSSQSAMAEETMLALENGLMMAITFSLLASVFIILNTFMMNVGQRRKQLAILRAVGATRSQIAALLFREAFLMAVIGTVFGIGLGLGGARLLIIAMNQLMQAPLPPIELLPWPFVVGALFGFCISFLGVMVPAWRASRVSPLEGMAVVVVSDVEGTPLLPTIGGLAFIAFMGVVLFGCWKQWWPINYSVSAVTLGLVGLVMLLPLALRPLTKLAVYALSPLLRVESRLARRQLLRHRGRTSLTVGVLFVAVSTGIALASAVVDNVEDVRDWYKEVIVGDYFVRAMMPDMETGLSAAVPDEVGDELTEIDGIEQVDTLRFVAAEVVPKEDEPGERVIVVTRGNIYRADAAGPDLLAVRKQVPDGAVVVGSVLAQRQNLKVGDSIWLTTVEGRKSFPVSEIVNDYSAGGLTVHMSRPMAEKWLQVEGVDAFMIAADHERLNDVATKIQAICDERGLLLQRYVDIALLIERMMGGVVGGQWALLVLALLVAAFGVVNTLGMNVLEQTRELSLLRVVAMTRRQVRRMIVAQAAMMGLLGVVPAMIAGVAFAYVINISTMPVTGHPVDFVLRPWLLVSGLVTSLVIVLAAAWIPALRASRLELAAALRYQ